MNGSLWRSHRGGGFGQSVDQAGRIEQAHDPKVKGKLQDNSGTSLHAFADRIEVATGRLL
jgi:hypothetical protein